MDAEQTGSSKTILSWIASLCISVVCCAVLFVIFAQYVVDMKHSLNQANDKLETMSLRDEQLLAEIKTLHLMMASNQKGASPEIAATQTLPQPTPQPAPEGIVMPVPGAAPAPVAAAGTNTPPAATDLAAPATPPGPPTVAPLPGSSTQPAATAPALPPVSVPSIQTKP